MKKIFLGVLPLLFSSLIASEPQNYSLIEEQLLVDNSIDAGCCKRLKRSDILASINSPIQSTSGTIIRPTGVIEERSFILTVLNSYPEEGVYRIRVQLVPSGTIHEFLVGRIGDAYFGQGTEDRVFGITLKRVKRHLEVTYSISGNNVSNSQVRAEFPL